jgi:hypothetical protein
LIKFKLSHHVYCTIFIFSTFIPIRIHAKGVAIPVTHPICY